MKEKIIKILKVIIPIILLAAAIFGIIKLCLFIQAEQQKENIKNIKWLRENTTLELDKTLGSNVYKINAPDYVDVFNMNYQKAVDEDINKLLKEGKYSLENPLVIYNAYGISPTSINVYFTTEDEEQITYKVKVKEDNISDYERTLKGTTKDHSYQLIGLVAGYENTISLKYDDEIESFKVDLTNITTESQVQADVTENRDDELSNGLFTVQGNDSTKQDYIALYDNDGILRGEYLVKNYRSHKILFKDDLMYYSTSRNDMIEVNNLGKITKKFDLGNYELHHDYVFDDDMNLLVLASDLKQDSVEDVIVKIDVETKKVTEVLDLGDIFSQYKEKCYFDEENGNSDGEKGLDWMHINTLQYIDGDVILSSRETSSIIKINDIEEEPSIGYILGEEAVWKDTPYTEYLYDKDGDFTISGGQHSVTYQDNDDDDDGIYYLYMFNNNYGRATTRPDFDWTTIGLNNTESAFVGDTSSYYKYEVNENEKTFKLINSFNVPYSGIVSSVQEMDNGNIIVDSGVKGQFIEYNSEGKKIRIYKLNMNKYFIYRVLKYDFNNFYYE